jgi:putative transcriptional regulator
MLLSMPHLLDPNFNRTVVLLCNHSEEKGAFGLVVNRPLVTTSAVVVELRTESEVPAHEGSSSPRELQVWIGGPVDPHRSWILVGRELDDEGRSGIRVCDGVHLSTSPDLLHQLLGPTPPLETRLIVGHARWAPGQLEKELEACAWLICDVDRELIFTTKPDRMWDAAIRGLGANPETLQASRGTN